MTSVQGSAGLPSQTMQRLALIRYLYKVGIEQSRQPEPVAALSLLSLHDSIELFLQLAAEKVNAKTTTRIEFANYFDLIDDKLQPDSLYQRPAIQRLNKDRVALKHHGTLPSRISIEQGRADATRFFEDNTPLVFGLPFSEISLVELVVCEPARDELRQATSSLAAGDTATAMTAIALAFAHLVDDFEKKLVHPYRSSPFSFGPAFSPFDSSFHRKGNPLDTRKQQQFEDKLKESVEALQDAVRILALGLDYRRYAQFQAMTPRIQRMFDGRYQPIVVTGLAGSMQWPPSHEACQFCFDFVIDTAIRLQEYAPPVIPQR